MSAAREAGPELVAGRALDGLVAERVMGYVWGEPIHYRDGEPHAKWLMPEKTLDKGIMLRPDIQIAAPETCRAANWSYMVPPYSTDIAAAWSIVEAMTGKDWSVVIRDDFVHGGWRCAFLTGPWHRDFAVAAGDTMPIAICRAALAAIATADPPDAAVARGT